MAWTKTKTIAGKQYSFMYQVGKFKHEATKEANYERKRLSGAYSVRVVSHKNAKTGKIEYALYWSKSHK